MVDDLLFVSMTAKVTNKAAQRASSTTSNPNDANDEMVKLKTHVVPSVASMVVNVYLLMPQHSDANAKLVSMDQTANWMPVFAKLNNHVDKLQAHDANHSDRVLLLNTFASTKMNSLTVSRLNK